jgi:hypothetical protein
MFTTIPNRIDRSTDVVEFESTEWITFCMVVDRLKRLIADSNVYAETVPFHQKQSATRPILDMHLSKIR